MARFATKAGNIYAPTPREMEVWQLIAEGLSSREISQRLGCAEQTVWQHRMHLAAKLGLTGTTSLGAKLTRMWIERAEQAH